MKNYLLTSVFTTILTSIGILFSPQSSLALDTSLLTEVVKSCQEDATSSKYYERIGIDFLKWGQSEDNIKNYIGQCVELRYHYSLVLSKLTWQSSAGEIFPGYPGDVATSIIAYFRPSTGWGNLGILDCIVSQDSSSKECANSVLWLLSDKANDISLYYVYTCPFCFVAYKDIDSKERMISAFIKWFMALDKPKRKQVMSILGDDSSSVSKRSEMLEEARQAVNKYRDIRQKVQRQEQEQRRREILGE